MGVTVSKTFKKLFAKKEVRVLMLGLDGAGKTTILYKLKLDQPISTIPTVGFNVETLKFNNLRLNVWDVGGQDKIRPLWRHYYTGSQGLLFVVDSQDVDRLEESKQELHRILRDREMQNCVLLILANKQDQPNAIKPSDVAERLGLTTLKNRTWCVQPSCALTGEGLIEGLVWLSDHLTSTHPGSKRKVMLENRKTVLKNVSPLSSQIQIESSPKTN